MHFSQNMYFTSPTSNITPALVSVAMSRSDSRDSNYSSTSSNFSAAPLTVSYSTSPCSHFGRSISSARRASSSTSTTPSQWIPSPYRSSQLRGGQGVESEASGYLSDDDLLYIAPFQPPTSYPAKISLRRPELPVESIPTCYKQQREMTTEEQIAILRAQQEKTQEEQLVSMQQARRQAAMAAQKAVRFANVEHKSSGARRGSGMTRRRSTMTRKGSNGQ